MYIYIYLRFGFEAVKSSKNARNAENFVSRFAIMQVSELILYKFYLNTKRATVVCTMVQPRKKLVPQAKVPQCGNPLNKIPKLHFPKVREDGNMRVRLLWPEILQRRCHLFVTSQPN